MTGVLKNLGAQANPNVLPCLGQDSHIVFLEGYPFGVGGKRENRKKTWAFPYFKTQNHMATVPQKSAHVFPAKQSRRLKSPSSEMALWLRKKCTGGASHPYQMKLGTLSAIDTRIHSQWYFFRLHFGSPNKRPPRSWPMAAAEIKCGQLLLAF